MIKSVVECKDRSEYPKIMINNSADIIVLFTDEAHGTIIHSLKNTYGNYYDSWEIDSFKQFHGSVTLTQE